MDDRSGEVQLYLHDASDAVESEIKEISEALRLVVEKYSSLSYSSDCRWLVQSSAAHLLHACVQADGSSLSGELEGLLKGFEEHPLEPLSDEGVHRLLDALYTEQFFPQANALAYATRRSGFLHPWFAIDRAQGSFQNEEREDALAALVEACSLSSSVTSWTTISSLYYALEDNAGHISSLQRATGVVPVSAEEVYMQGFAWDVLGSFGAVEERVAVRNAVERYRVTIREDWDFGLFEHSLRLLQRVGEDVDGFLVGLPSLLPVVYHRFFRGDASLEDELFSLEREAYAVDPDEPYIRPDSRDALFSEAFSRNEPFLANHALRPLSRRTYRDRVVIYAPEDGRFEFFQVKKENVIMDNPWEFLYTPNALPKEVTYSYVVKRENISFLPDDPRLAVFVALDDAERRMILQGFCAPAFKQFTDAYVQDFGDAYRKVMH